MRRAILQYVFNQIYTRFAWAYNYAAWMASAGHWYQWVEAGVPFILEGPVLEVGCGRGYLLRKMMIQGLDVIGVDYAEEMCRYARDYSRQPVVRADGRQLPFEDNAFAALVTTFPAPYILGPATQAEFARVVRPGGVWVWVDVPRLEPQGATGVALSLNKAVYGEHALQTAPRAFLEDTSGGLWNVDQHRVAVGNTTIGVRVARRPVNHYVERIGLTEV